MSTCCVSRTVLRAVTSPSMPSAFHCEMISWSCLGPWDCLSRFSTRMIWLQIWSTIAEPASQVHQSVSLSAWRTVEVMQWVWHRQEKHTSHLTSLLTFLELCLRLSPKVWHSLFPLPVTSSFTSVWHSLFPVPVTSSFTSVWHSLFPVPVTSSFTSVWHSLFPVPVTSSFTSVCRGSISFVCTIDGPTFVPQHSKLWLS